MKRLTSKLPMMFRYGLYNDDERRLEGLPTSQEIYDKLKEYEDAEENKMLVIAINLNDWIKVKLTSYGKQVFTAHYLIFGMKPPIIKVDDNGYSTFQLWEFIEIFGAHIYMGAQNVIEPLEIIKE